MNAIEARNDEQEEIRLMTLTDICSALRVSERTAYRMISRGTLRAIKIGWSLRFSPTEVERIVQAGTNQ